MSQPSPYRQIVGQPSSGGDLISRLSPENVGASNYVVKRDWRRETDGETRREGHSLFAPNSDVVAELQSNIGSSNPVTLLHFARKATGKTAIIAGTSTTLYRYYSFEDGEVYESGVYTTGVYADESGQWLIIGDNFSAASNRWEAKDVAGKTIFNNGTDLPVVYDLGWLSVRPLKELREQGVAFASTIEEYNGLLLLADVAELSDEHLATVMNGRNVSNLSQVGTNVSATVDTFTSDDVGKTITWGTGEQAVITGLITPQIVTADAFQTVGLGPARISILYGAVTDESLYSRVQYRIVNSGLSNPEDFDGGAIGTFTAGSFTVTLSVPCYTIVAGDVVTIPGAGASGAALETTVLNVDGYGQIFTFSDAAITTASGVYMQKTSTIGSLSAATDLQDDNSAILRMSELQGRLVVFKEGPIFVGQYVGTAGLPVQYQKVYNGPNSIYWRWILSKVNGSYLLYASKNGFFTFELSSLSPKEHNKLTLCQDIVFDQLDETTDLNEAWSADNVVTNEIWIAFPSATDDKILCYDYRYDTCATVSTAYQAAVSASKPSADIPAGLSEEWFVLADNAGNVYQYGLTNLGGGLWTKAGSTYTSTLKSGLINASDDYDEKDLRSFVVYFGGFSETPVRATLYGTRNPHEPVSQLFQRVISNPTYKTLIPTYFRKNYYQDQLEVVSSTTNAKIIRRVYDLCDVDSRSTIRNNST